MAFSVIVNMMLVAFWHAFTVAFLIFGILHSIYLVCDVLTASARKRYYKRHAGAAKLTALAGPVFVYHMVAVSLVFMRATSLTQGMQVLTGLTAGLGHAVEALAEALAPPRHYVWSAVPFTILAVIAEHLRRRGVFEDLSAAPRWLRWSVSACTTVWVLFLILVFLGQRGEVNPFVYAKF